MPNNTKRALGDSLKQRLKEKPLEKITITDICSGCKVNRQTFYYHFQDIYDLVEWIYLDEAGHAMGKNATYDTWMDAYLQIFEYALHEKTFAISTYHSISREYLESFLYKQTYQLLYGVVHEVSKQYAVKEEDKAFIANFYKYAFVGLILDWVGKGMKEDPHIIVNKAKNILEGSFIQAIQRFQVK